MSDEVIKVLDNLSERFGVVIDWSSQNVLPYIQQLSEKIVRWEIATSLFWLIIGVLLCVSLIWQINGIKYAAVKEKENKWSNWDFTKQLLITLAVVTALIGVGMILSQLYDIITCLAFPEKILIDFAREMMQGGAG